VALIGYSRPLATPSVPAHKNQACPAILLLVPWFVLLDAHGHAVGPRVPIDSCHQPQRETLDALQALTLPTVAEKPIRRVASAGSISTGCSQQWKHELAVEAPDRQGLPAGSAQLQAPFRVCIYEVPAGHKDDELPVGDFVRGAVLEKAASAQLCWAVHDQPANSCGAHSTRFAVLMNVDSGDVSYVEMDGCFRVMPSQGGLRQGEQALADLLAKLVA